MSRLALMLFLAMPQQSVDEVVAGVSTRVREFREFAPNVVCTEIVRSGEFEKDGKMVKVKSVESVFRPTRITNGRTVFSPTREVVAVDGKALKKDAKVPASAIIQSTDYTFVPSIAFAPDNLDSRIYRLASPETIDGVRGLVVEFVTKEDQKGIRINDPLLGAYLLKDSGKAWIHPDTKRILKLEDRYLNDPDSAREVAITFGEFTIDGTAHWLPKSIRYSVTDKKKKPVGFIAEYSNCRINRGQ